MSERRKRRSGSDDEKREICQQTTVPGVSIAQVARRYAANANQTHNWLKDERFAPEPEEPLAAADDDGFVEIDLGSYSGPVSPQPTATLGGPVSATRIDLIWSDGCRILIEGGLAAMTRQSGQWRGKARIGGGRKHLRDAL